MGINTKIQESPNPVDVHCLRLAANRIVDLSGESNAYQETENLDSSQDGEASMNTFHESLVLSPYVRQGVRSIYTKISGEAYVGLSPQGPQGHTSLEAEKGPLHTPSRIRLGFSLNLRTTQKPSLQRSLESFLSLKLEKRMITAETTSPWRLPSPLPSWASEETPRTPTWWHP